MWLRTLSMHVEPDPATEDLTTEDLFLYSLIVTGLVLFSGCMSGLNVGMMSLDQVGLRLKAQDGSPQERKMASRLLPVVSQHHWLLVSILLGNAAASETLPIVLSQVFSEVVSVLLSVTLILICSEIIPQALLTGPNQLKIASRMTILVKIVMVLFFPISFPLSKLLDMCLGKHNKQSSLSVEDLKMFLELKRHERRPEVPNCLSCNELNFISGVTDIGSRPVKDFVIPLNRVFALSDQAQLNRECLKQIGEKSYKRIPIFKGEDPSALYTVLNTSCLVGLKPSFKSVKEAEVERIRPLTFYADDLMSDLLVKFHKSSCKIGFVYESPLYILKEPDSPSRAESVPKCLGLITLRDVLKSLLKKQRARSDIEFKLPAAKTEVELIVQRC
mmetsp:Transcript_26001/g.46011  ORF Transcript_26001/g.46011 Transcript_26001/m.46011 type:complete len:388 (-) Transcript_26001:28-1191(-)